MLDLSKIPHERWAVDIESEAKHPRMQEFKDSFCKYHGYNYGFSSRFYGRKIDLDFKDQMSHVDDVLPEGVTLLTLDQVIEYCEPLPESKPEPEPFDNFEATERVLTDINQEREAYVQLLILAAKADRNDLVQFILNKIV